MPALLSRAKRAVLTLTAASTIATGVAVAAPIATPAAQATTLTLGQRAVVVASEQAGKPYRFGAAGPSAFDCSGLVTYVYGRLGVRLPHNAELQYRATTHLTHAQLRPGDLVFMALGGGGTGSIDHVGIYAGNGYWWVARHTGTTITRQRIWTSAYWVGRVRA